MGSHHGSYEMQLAVSKVGVDELDKESSHRGVTVPLRLYFGM